MWSEYYTCKGCEDEVNRKGHLTRPQEAVHVENVKNDFNFEKLKNLSSGTKLANWIYVWQHLLCTHCIPYASQYPPSVV